MTHNSINTPALLNKGDLLIGQGGGLNPAILAAAANGQVLTLDSSQPTGTKWASSGSSKIAQLVSASTSSLTDVSATFPHDNTIPQNTEGTEILTVSITPTNASSQLVIWGMAQGVAFYSGTYGAMIACLFRDTNANALAIGGANSNVGMWASVPLLHSLTAGNTSPTTFKMRVGLESTAGSPHFYVNGSSGGRLYGGASLCYLIVAEIAP
jgi:hypothetical protein